MYISEFVCGVVVTILAEVFLLIVSIVHDSIKKKKKWSGSRQKGGGLYRNRIKKDGNPYAGRGSPHAWGICWYAPKLDASWPDTYRNSR